MAVIHPFTQLKLCVWRAMGRPGKYDLTVLSCFFITMKSLAWEKAREQERDSSRMNRKGFMCTTKVPGTAEGLTRNFVNKLKRRTTHNRRAFTKRVVLS